MTIQEFLRSQKFEEVFKQLINRYTNELDILEYKKENPDSDSLLDEEIFKELEAAKREDYQRTWNELISMNYKRGISHVVMCSSYKDIDMDGNIINVDDTSLYKSDELERVDITLIKETSSYDELVRNYSKAVENYSVIDIDWKDLLGFEMAECSFKYIDRIRAAASIFWDCTWFGFSYEDNQRNKEAERSELERRINEVEENGFEGCIGAEELFEELYKEIEENMTEEEIQKSRAEREAYKRKCDEIEPIMLIDNYNRRQRQLRDLHEEFIHKKTKD